MNSKTKAKEDAVKAVADRMAIHDHRQVVFCNDKATGLRAIIAIHDTTLGPALGGTRMWTYKSESEALEDALRLSRGMTYKSALAGLDLGGGKAVIIGNSRTDKTEAMFRRYGRFVNSLNGQYVTAEDVGMSPADMINIRKETPYVTGLPASMGGGGDPSPVTAYGVFCGMKAAARTAYGNERLSGRKVAVQGAGNVGLHLVEHLLKDGATVYLADIDQEKLKRAKEKHPRIQVVEADQVIGLDVDIYAPCALGASINDETIPLLKCSVIAGSANNQLADEDVHGRELMEKGILYAPDFLINAGGIINCAWEYRGYDHQAAMDQAQGIYETALAIFKRSAEAQIPTHLAANRAAEQRIEAVRQAGLAFH